ncbi:Hypothetical Protein FCC1311_001202 [Hondaea fermentalgiana]|uniref:Uncharacterized protein n=1 Tax=Hondaea fermentalgiana TaxID=2315210 RepID=A0A2R5G786_9STRA|nr:Hypothetical Protein FCC1311_001202 [Hondaea fermentalgiana]|eukprot:GBG23901.1 Hypothetical Protein FCC1311_001202 [Hondaea fermentalgiana]
MASFLEDGWQLEQASNSTSAVDGQCKAPSVELRDECEAWIQNAVCTALLCVSPGRCGEASVIDGGPRDEPNRQWQYGNGTMATSGDKLS